MHTLRDKQELFCHEYLVDLNATQAAIRAGYARKRASEQGYQLLQKTTVSERIVKLKAERAKKTEIDADYVLTSLKATAERCMSETGFNPNGANRALELLGRHLGLFSDKLAIKLDFDPSDLTDEELSAIIAGK